MTITMSSVVADSSSGVPNGDYVLWGLTWIPLAVLTVAGTWTRAATKSEPHRLTSPALRTVHGISAVTILVIFLMPHIANHLTAIWSVDAHTTVMRTLRHIYRAELVQPLLVVLFIFQIANDSQCVMFINSTIYSQSRSQFSGWKRQRYHSNCDGRQHRAPIQRACSTVGRESLHLLEARSAGDQRFDRGRDLPDTPDFVGLPQSRLQSLPADAEVGCTGRRPAPLQ